MTNETKKTFDMFGVTDIENIQAEIERNLANIHVARPLEKPHYLQYAASINQPTESVFTSKNLSLPDVFVTEHDFLRPIDTRPTPATGDFYRETIKSTPQNTSSPWLKKAVAFALIFTLGTGSLGFGLGAGVGFMRFRGQEPTEIAHAGNNPDDGVTLTSTTYTFENAGESPGVGGLADIVELLKPSVVGIVSYYGRETRYGSGVIFAENSEQIFIVTSNYVVSGMERVSVSIAGSTHINAHPAGEDTTVDLSVISIYKSQLIDAGIGSIVVATFGDSDQMRVGDTVLAIGNAMGGGNSVTRGVISSAEKTIVLPPGGHTLSLLQTDAAINYGNSGGPLINTRGEVIGININRMSNRFFGMAAVEGMGYSVSSNIIVPLLDDMVNRRRPALGILGGTVTPEIAARYNIPTIGVYVQTVVEGRAAYRGGMQNSDIITGFNGLPVLNWQQLVYAIRSSQIGTAVEVNVLRNGTDAVTLQIVLDAMIVENF